MSRDVTRSMSMWVSDARPKAGNPAIAKENWGKLLSVGPSDSTKLVVEPTYCIRWHVNLGSPILKRKSPTSSTSDDSRIDLGRSYNVNSGH
jgi:hypothetical protein